MLIILRINRQHDADDVVGRTRGAGRDDVLALGVAPDARCLYSEEAGTSPSHALGSQPHDFRRSKSTRAGTKWTQALS